MPTDTSERGLEQLICNALTGEPCDPPAADAVHEPAAAYGGVGWSCGNPHDYDPEFCVDLMQFGTFLHTTQPETASRLALAEDGPARKKFLNRLKKEVGARGTIDVLRNGIEHGAHSLRLFYGTPSAENEQARLHFEKNRFTVTRQLHFSTTDTALSLDMVLFINGLPVLTFELKNNLTRQTVADAMEQYKNTRSPLEDLFKFGRCLAHFALDENEARFSTHLKGKKSWFLPFNRGYNDGAGNPPNPNGLRVDYLWREVLTRKSLTNIIENYAQVLSHRDKIQIWPRYHQLDVVRKLLTDVEKHGVGKRYLIQHSAGSGKSNSIAWLARQLINVKQEDEPVFHSIIVVTDRRILDRQISDTIKQYAQVRATIGHAKNSGDLRRFLESGKKIIISTIQKFPHILKEIGDEQRSRRFAIIIDEAHSSQGGSGSAAVSGALSEEVDAGEEEVTFEDKINRIIQRRKMLSNASYFAFTATPKNKTLELFGERDPQADDTVKHRVFHSYTMKQAIQEGFIMDVLANYIPVDKYYRLAKTIEGDPEFDVHKSNKKLQRYVDGHERAIRLKAEIMVDHFMEQVVAQHKIGGKARAMVVTDGIRNAVRYFYAIRDYLEEINSQYKAIAAFSDEKEIDGIPVSESSLNSFPSRNITEKFREDPYRFLICADKFQTGYDEPLLHTMYVDKKLSGVKAVQTLSRLNRAYPKKHDVFVLDFKNDLDTIREAFSDYYRTTILADETDPDKLHNLKNSLDREQIYSPEQVPEFVKLYLNGAERDQLDPILDESVSAYQETLNEDGQVKFKGNAKSFVRTYEFLASILNYGKIDWENLAIFLRYLIPKLPSPQEEDLSKGILDAIDMESLRFEKLEVQKILLSDKDSEIDPVPTGGGGGINEPEMDKLSIIIANFNNRFGNIEWEDPDRIVKRITEEIPEAVSNDPAYRNAMQSSDRQNAEIECGKALSQVIISMLYDDGELLKQFSDNEDFKRWLTATVFDLTYHR